MKRLADQTLYEILEVPPDASPEQIQAAYEKARALYGPGSIVTYTLIEPDEAALLEARIEDARGTLLDTERRARYDASLEGRAEPRAAAGGSAAPSVGAPAPVIPALQPAPPREAAPAHAAAAPAPPEPEHVSTPAPVTPPVPSGAIDEAARAEPPPAPRPILLEREVPPAPAPPAETRAPAAAATAAPVDAPVEHAAPTTAAPPAAAPGPVVPPPIPDAWTGEALKQVREARGLSIPAISERTKVTRHHIENIEADRFAALPAQVYLRGILLALARELRLDGQKVARSYLERVAGVATSSPSQTKPR